MNSYHYHSKCFPSFLIGIARILDIKGSLNHHKHLYEYDSKFEDFNAIHSDWKAVGDDIRGAFSDIY